MSIYLAPANSGVSNPIFKSYGIANKMPGQLSELPACAYPGEIRSHYDTLLTSLPGLLKAQIEGFPSHTPAHSIGIFAKVKDLPGLRFSPPTGYFEFRGLSDVDRDTILRAGLTLEPSRPNVYTGCPSFDMMADIFKLNPESSRFPPGYTSADGILAYSFLVKGLALFGTISHTLGQDTAAYIYTTPGEIENDIGTIRVEYGAIVGTVGISLDAMGHTIIGNTSLRPVCVPTDDHGTFHRGYTSSSRMEIVHSNHGGRFFPYFDGMTLPDRTLAPQTFSDIFFNCLFDDISKAPGLMNRIRKGFGSIANKESGMALSHAYFGIRLAKQGHAFITFIISNGIYQGFVLEGDFVFALYGQEYKPVLNTELRAHIRAINRHDLALVKIVGLLGLAKRADGTTIYVVTPEDINTSRKLVRVYRSLVLADFALHQDFQDDLRSAVSELEYGERYAPMNSNSIEIFLNYVLTENETLMDNQPAWIHGGYLERCSSIVAVGLGIFGNVAPNISYGSDKDRIYSIPRDLDVEDPNLRSTQESKRSLQYLPVKKVEIERALGAWNAVFEKGKIRIPHGRKGKEEFTDGRQVTFSITGVSFDRVYRKVKEIVAQRVVGPAKRKANEVAGGAGVDKGKKRAREMDDLSAI